MNELIPPTVNLLILIGILVYTLRKPVKEMVASRQTAIKAQVDEARLQKNEAEKKYREFSDKLNVFESEAKQILDRAQDDAQALKTRILSDARAAADRIIKEAEVTAQANLQDYKDQIRRETIAKAVEMAESVIREGLSKDDQRRIVNEYVGKVQAQ